VTRRDISALIAFIDSRQSVAHAWGRDENDCVSFVLGAVEAQLGVRIAADIHWTSRPSARRIIARFGTLEGAFDAHFERIAPAFARRGDIAGVADDEFGIHPMIVEGDLLVGPGDRGNRRMKRSAMVVAWSIEKARQ
jgi:hypothetical protein